MINQLIFDHRVVIYFIMHQNLTNFEKKKKKKVLSQDSVAHLTCALPLNQLKSMTHDIDLKVTQVGRDGTA